MLSIFFCQFIYGSAKKHDNKKSKQDEQTLVTPPGLKFYPMEWGTTQANSLAQGQNPQSEVKP